MKKAISITAGVVIVAASVGFVGMKLTENKHIVDSKVYRKDTNLKVTIQADTIRYNAFQENLTFLGTFAPNRTVVISSETNGKVIKVGIQEGSHVQSGSLVAQLDTEILQAQLRSAQANYDNAQNSLNRFEQAASGITALQIDNARTQLLLAKAQIEQLKKQISMATIKAPFAGTITKRNFDLGSVIGPGSPMAELNDISQVKLEVSVPEKNITLFKKGQIIAVQTDVFPDKTFQGIVELVSVIADASHNFVVKVLVKNPSAEALKAGMYGRVNLAANTAHQSLSIPRTALVGSTKKPQVFVVANGIAKLTDIETGISNETHIQVIKGLSPNQVVATGGLVNLTDGCKVTVAQ